MVLTLYGSTTCPPVCAVRLVCEALGVEYEFKITSGAKGETRTPEFLQMNPQHCIPTIKDDDFVLWDSHAIAAYLADKVGASEWYPTDVRRRAVVDQRLHFDNATLFLRQRNLVEPLFYADGHELAPDRVQKLEEAVELLGELIQDGGWLAGDRPTIADCCAAANAFSILAILPTIEAPAKVTAWLKRCEDTLPGFDSVAKPGLLLLAQTVADKISKA